jgi:hypothetical protein
MQSFHRGQCSGRDLARTIKGDSLVDAQLPPSVKRDLNLMRALVACVLICCNKLHERYLRCHTSRGGLSSACRLPYLGSDLSAGRPCDRLEGKDVGDPGSSCLPESFTL